MAKVILVSQIPLPYPEVGSWSTLYYNYLSNSHQIDYVICYKPDRFFDTVRYQFVFENVVNKIRRNFLNNPIWVI